MLQELRAETAAAYPERRNNQVSPEQVQLAWKFMECPHLGVHHHSHGTYVLMLLGITLVCWI